MRYGLFGQHTMLPNHALRVAGTVLAVTLSMTACKLDEKDVRLEPPLVRVTTVVPAAQAERAFTGVISARVQGNIGFRVAGKIIERLVDTGQVVKVGQPLMRIEALGKVDANVPLIMPERAAKTPADVQIKDAIGSGPFKFVKEEWEPGHRAVFVRSPDYLPRKEPPSWATGGQCASTRSGTCDERGTPASRHQGRNAGGVDF